MASVEPKASDVVLTVSSSLPRSTSGRITSSSIRCGAAGSSQTVCQGPVVGV